MTDITEQGAQNYKDLQDQNNQDFTTPKQEGGTVGRLKLLRHLERVTPSVRSTHYNELPLEFGDSKYDRNERVPMYNLKDLEASHGIILSTFRISPIVLYFLDKLFILSLILLS